MEENKRENARYSAARAAVCLVTCVTNHVMHDLPDRDLDACSCVTARALVKENDQKCAIHRPRQYAQPRDSQAQQRTGFAEEQLFTRPRRARCATNLYQDKVDEVVVLLGCVRGTSNLFHSRAGRRTKGALGTKSAGVDG